MAKYNLDRHSDRTRFKGYAAQLLKGRKKVELTAKSDRSLSQFRYLHVLLGIVAMEIGEPLEGVKQAIYKRQICKDIFVRQLKDGQIYLRSASSLNTEELTRSIDRLRTWAAIELGCYLPRPDEKDAVFAAEQEIRTNSEFL